MNGMDAVCHRLLMRWIRAAAIAGSLIVAAVAAAQPLHDQEVRQGADETRSLVAEMLADAQTRTSMLQSDSQAGHDGRFFIGSSDGSFRLSIFGLLQFRYHLNFREADTTVNGDSFESGFNIARMLLFFRGYVYDPKLFYQVRLGVRRTDGASVLDDAFVGYKFNERWSIQFGQSLHPFDREWYHGDLKLLAVERSLPALAFGGFRTQNAQLKYQDDEFRTILTYSDGLRSKNSDLGADPADWAVTARGEWKFAGAWSQVGGQFTSPRGSDYAGALGGAIHFEQGPNTGMPMAQQDLFAWTADLVVKGDGWNLMAAGTGYHTKDEAGISGADYDEYGAVVQGGVYITKKAELFGRYSVLIPDDDRAGDGTFNTITAGVNWYWHGPAAMFTIQAQWFLDPTTNTVVGNFANSGGRNPTSTLFGSLPSDNDDQVMITAQIQLLF